MDRPFDRPGKGEVAFSRAFALAAASLFLSALGSAQIPNAGPDQAMVFPGTATLSGSIQGGTPLIWWTGDGNGATENDLILYDDRTGVTPIGPLRLATGGAFGNPTDLVRIGATLYGIDGLRRMLYTVDTSSGIVTPVGGAWSSLYADVESLAYEGARNRLLGVDRATGQLLELSRTTGAAIPIGNRTLAAFTNIRSLAWRPANGLLYAVDQATRAILSINPANGLPAVLCTMAPEAHGRIEELDFVGDRMYGVDAIDDGAGNLVSAQLQRIFPTVGMVQNLGPVLTQVSAQTLRIDSLPEDRVWTKVSGPGNVSFSDPYSLTPTVRFSKAGTYILQLTVTTSSGPRSDSVTITQGEWTTFTLSADARAIFVSSSTGNDANNGMSMATPKRTLAAGKSLLRWGYPDWLLLKCGDVWDESFSSGWGLSGRSANERMLLSSYGTGARPLIRTGTRDCLNIWDGPQGSNLAIVGIHFWPNLYNGSNGIPRCIAVYGAVQNLLIEDCFLQAAEVNLVIQGASTLPGPTGRHKNIALRRNVIVDAFTTGNDNTAGLYAQGTDGLVLDENVFDRNGWRDDIPGSVPTWYRRNIYIQDGNTDVVVVGNIVARTDGMQVRCGGLVEENLCLKNAISILFGGGQHPDPAGVKGFVRRNVVLDGNDLQPGSPRGWGINFENVGDATVDSNVVAHNASGHYPFPITFGVASNGAGVHNLTFSNNVVYAWNGYSRFTGNSSQTSNVQLIHNRIQNGMTADALIQHDQFSSTNGVTGSGNLFFSIASPTAWMQAGNPLSLQQWKNLVHDTTSVAQFVNFPDPSRTIATYQASLGGVPALENFMIQARQQSRAYWRPQYTAMAVNDYIRAGFGL